MKYPTILEYVKAIQNGGANLDRLAHLSPVLDDHGTPYHISGDSSVVFKMQDKSTGKYYALKCFTVDPSGCADAHLQNADEQNLDASSSSSSVKYLDKELLVLCQGKEEKYPVELMDWVSAFYDCESLSILIVPNNVTSIGESAFKNCNFSSDLKQELISRYGDKISAYLW